MTMADASLFDAFADDVPTAPKSQPAPRRSRKPRARAPEPDDSAPHGEPADLPRMVRVTAEYVPPAREWVVGGLFAKGTVSALIGPGGAGKSSVAALLAVSVSAGRPFLGRPILAPGEVIFVAAERADLTVRRLVAMSATGDPGAVVIAEAPGLAAEAGADRIRAAVEVVAAEASRGVAVVIIDTMSSCIAGADENSARVLSQVAANLRSIAAPMHDGSPGPAVVLVHHTGKNGTGARGSSALQGAVDLELSIEAKKEVSIIRATKANDLRPDAINLRFALAVADTPFGPVGVAREAADAAPPAGAGRPGKAEARAAMVARILEEFDAASRQPLERDMRDRFAELDGTAPEAAAKAWARLRDAGVFHTFTGLVRLGPDPKKSAASS